MKVTNLKTSKKLKELGFNGDHCDGYTRSGRLISAESPVGNYLIETPTYDLETILEAFPGTSEEMSGVITEADSVRVIEVKSLKDIGYKKEENESLANTAARLLIKLLEDNIIKLGG